MITQEVHLRHQLRMICWLFAGQWSPLLALPFECHKDAVLASVEAQTHLLLLVPNVTQPVATVSLSHGTDHSAGGFMQFFVLLKAQL